MSGVTAQITQESCDRWRNVAAEFSRVFRKTLPDVLTYTAWKFAMSGRAISPRCKAKLGLRDIVDNPARWPRYLVQRYTQRAGLQPFATNDAADPRRVIKWAGAAKNSWNGVMRSLGKSQARNEGAGLGATTAEAKKQFAAERPYVDINHYLSYLPKIAPRIMEESLDRVTRQMEYALTKQAKGCLSKALQKSLGVG